MNQIDGIPIGSARRAESGHSDSDDAVPRNLEQVECHDSDQKSQSRIEAAGNADNSRFGMRMYDSFRQSGRLHLEYFFAAFAQSQSFGRERMRIDSP